MLLEDTGVLYTYPLLHILCGNNNVKRFCPFHFNHQIERSIMWQELFSGEGHQYSSFEISKKLI